MAKFIYKMENILSIKNKLEEQARNAFGVAKAELDREEEKLEALERKKVFYQEKLLEQMHHVLNILEIKRCEDALEIMKYEIKMQKIAVNIAAQKLELARIKLNEAMIECKIHEKLKENAFEEFKQEVEAGERKEIDELVSFMYKVTGSEEE